MIDITVQEPSRLRDLVAGVDRSEVIELNYRVEDGTLVGEQVHWEVPAWDETGDGPHSVNVRVEFLQPILDRGGVLLGATSHGAVAGVAAVEVEFEPGTAWLPFLHVSRRFRRRGVAAELWSEAESLARQGGAASMLVSATPSASAVGFYLSRGCKLADPPHPQLLAKEPEDVHLVKRFV